MRPRPPPPAPPAPAAAPGAQAAPDAAPGRRGAGAAGRRFRAGTAPAAGGPAKTRGPAQRAFDLCAPVPECWRAGPATRGAAGGETMTPTETGNALAPLPRRRGPGRAGRGGGT